MNPLLPFDIFGFLESHPEIKRKNKYTSQKVESIELVPSRASNSFSSARIFASKANPAISGQGGSKHTFGVACHILKGFNLSQSEAISILIEWNSTCIPPWSHEDLARIIERADARPDTQPRGYATKPRRNYFDTQCKLIMEDNPEKKAHSGILYDPASIAVKFYENNIVQDDLCKYRYWDNCFYKWNGSFYSSFDKTLINADLFDFAEKMFLEKYILDKAEVPADKADKVKKIIAHNSLVENIKTGLINLISINTNSNQEPFWLKPHSEEWEPSDIIPTANRLVHLPSLVHGLTKTSEPKNPSFFSTYSLKYNCNFDSCENEVEMPPIWGSFLHSIFPDDPESISCLQEFCGYFLTPATHMQKILMFIGPKRSGKGTIIRMLKYMLGEENMCFPTFKSLITSFGKQSLIGKTLAVFPDARITARTDVGDVVECLLSISGEDPQTIDRKFMSHAHQKLSVRFLISSNELPRLTEHSSALVSRAVLIKFNQSFIDREDTGLEYKIASEIPHIFRWAIDGWKRFTERGYFIQPESGQEAINDFLNLSSPIQHFVGNCMEIEQGFKLDVKTAFTRYMNWCEYQNRENAGDMLNFIMRIKSGFPAIRFADQNRIMLGVHLKPGFESFSPDINGYATDENKSKYDIFP